MKIIVEYAGETRTLEAQPGASVLDVLQANNIFVEATCGGAGKCKRCQVLVRDDEGVRYELACMTPATDGMFVVAERQADMEVVEEGGSMLSFPADTDLTGYAMAIDIGTTTLAVRLYNLETGERVAQASRPNPQIAFGADVISRISASIDGKLDLMVNLIIDALCDMKLQMCKHAGISREQVVRHVIAGNTTMQHIAAALPPDTIGYNPFIPLSLFDDVREIPKLGTCYFAPCVAGYVGGDITAGLLARSIDGTKTQLFLDLGTNGEMALAHDGRIVTCATAAGPVFEGANVMFGMPAGPGAISQVRLAEGQVDITVVGGGKPVGICGTGIIDAVAALVREGIVDETGYLQDAEDCDACWEPWLGERHDSNVFFLTPEHDVYITQGDVRSMQLAKAAVCAGVRTLMDDAGVALEQIETVEIAGGFGRYLNLASAAQIGLFPAELQNRASSVGNTSVEGASALAISHAAHEALAQIMERCDYLELSTSAPFNGFYVEAMEFSEEAIGVINNQ